MSCRGAAACHVAALGTCVRADTGLTVEKKPGASDMMAAPAPLGLEQSLDASVLEVPGVCRNPTIRSLRFTRKTVKQRRVRHAARTKRFTP